MAAGLRKAAGLSLLAVSVLVLLALPGAASGEDEAALRYSRLTVHATFLVEVGYPDHPEASRSGFYRRLIQYEMRAIVAYDGRKISIPAKNALVGGRISVQDKRIQPESFVPPPEQRRWVPVCRGWDTHLDIRVNSTGPEGRWTFKPAPTASVSVSRGRMDVNPGAPIRWEIEGGCGEGNLGDHGRQFLGPTLDVAAPARARFIGQRPFSIFCKDSFSHELDGGPIYGHSFAGVAFFRITFTPFPRDQLGQNKDRLRSAAGKQEASSLGQAPPAAAKDCL